MDAPLFDIHHLRSLTDGDQVLEKELLDAFRGTTARCLAKIDFHSIDNWQITLHELRGASAAVGGVRLSDHCAERNWERLTLVERREFLLQLHEIANDMLDEFSRKIKTA